MYRTICALLLSACPAMSQVVFEPPVATPLFHVTQGVISADLNLDGHVDLITMPRFPGGFSTAAFSVLLGNGDGGFGAPLFTSLGAQNAGRGRVAFLNDDAIPDLVLPFHPGVESVRLFFGAGDGTFPTSQTISVAFAQSIADVIPVDLTGDGKLDFFVLDAGLSIFLPGRLLALVADGAGYTLVSGPSLQLGATHVALGDVNGDAVLDAVVANDISGSLSIALGLGAGNFAAPTNVAVGGSPRDLAMADFDGDGKLDLAFADASSANRVVLMHGDGAGHFSTVQTLILAGTPSRLSVGMLDPDAMLDLVVSRFGSGEITVLRGVGDGSFTVGVTVSHVPNADGSTLADFDEDGLPDVAVGSYVGLGTFEPFSSVYVMRNHTYSTSSPFLDLGHALAGSKGYPILLAEGDLQPATPMQLRLANGLPLGQATLVLGFRQIDVPFKGGVMVPSVDVLVPGLAIDAQGGVTLDASWPAGVSSGLSFFAQYWFKDLAAPTHEGSSSAVRVITP